jgi:hypothetical protein
MTSTATDDRQERILSAVRKGQELTLDAIKVTVDVASRVTSRLPEVKLPSGVKRPFEGKVPFEDTLQKLRVPFESNLQKLEDRLPKPESLVSGAYDFAEKLLADQRKFASEVLKTTAALRSSVKDSAVKDSAAGEGAAGASAAEEHIAREDVAQESAAVQNAAVENVAQESAAQENAAVENAAQESAAVESAAVESAPEEDEALPGETSAAETPAGE